MIPFFRSLNELMAITQSRTYLIKSGGKSEIKAFYKNINGQKKPEKNGNGKKAVTLPSLPKSKRRKWIKSKEAVSKFLDNLDYNNQIQSSLDLTLLERQQKYEHKDIA